MKRLLTAFSAAAVMLSLSLAPAFAADDEDVERYENKVKRVNNIADKPGMMKVALQRISTETGVPLEKVQSQHQKHPEVGAAGLLIANVLANETKKAPAHFLQQREGGKRWLGIARDANVSVDKLNERLDRFERALTPETGRK